MSLSKYSKRCGQFEALEAKQLFAADLVGGAAIDLPDTVSVAKNVRANIGGIRTAQSLWQDCNDYDGFMDPADVTNSLKVKDFTVDNTQATSNGGNTALTIPGGVGTLPVLSDQEGEDVVRRGVDVAEETSGVVDSLASSKTSEALHGYINNDEVQLSGVDQVFEQYARDDFQITDQHYFAVR